MWKIFKYTFYDLMRSRWTYIYFMFYLLLAFAFIWASGDLTKVIVTMMNVTLVLIPLIATMFGIMTYYNSMDFTMLLLSQPIPRTKIFLGQYLGLSVSLALSVICGLAIPFMFSGIMNSPIRSNFFMLITVCTILTFIFSALAFYIAIKNTNKIKGFGVAIIVWLLFAVIYDGIFLLLLSWYGSYNLEMFSLSAIVFNPIDLSRVLLLLKLDISALMGYTGAVFSKILGQGSGFFYALLALLLWIVIPVLSMVRAVTKRDF